MFQYYGQKKSYIDKYPIPQYDTIIEPFAGSASYSLQYHTKNIILIEQNEIICNIWKYLISPSTTSKKILNLPLLNDGESTNDEKYNYLKQVEKDLIGFFIHFGAHPGRKTSPIGYNKWNENSRKILAENVKKVKHWKIEHKSYLDLDSALKNRITVTWFIDPPYQGKGGNQYKYGNKHIEYTKLSDWVRSLQGQVIVCENEEATWLPFKKLVNKVQSGRAHIERVYHRKSNSKSNIKSL